MTTRRGLFKSIAGLAIAAAVGKPRAKRFYYTWTIHQMPLNNGPLIARTPSSISYWPVTILKNTPD